MKRKMIALILAGGMAMTLFGCGSGAPAATAAPETPKVQESQPPEPPRESSSPDPVEEGFSFTQLKKLQFVFSSGAGGWATLLTIDENGGFSGEWYDGEMGETGEDYPNGTMYRSEFTGTFAQPEKVNEYTWSTRILEMSYAEEIGKEEIRDGVRYCYGEAYGLDGAEEILIYLPGAPLAELPEEFRLWVDYAVQTAGAETELPFYGLYNEAEQNGFSSYAREHD